MLKRFVVVVAGVVGLSSSVFAGTQRFVCNSFDQRTSKLTGTTVVLKSLEKGDIRDGQVAKFELQVFKGAKTYPEYSKEGTATLEDVVFSFKSNDQKVEFGIYLDEADQASLTISGRDAGGFVCR